MANLSQVAQVPPPPTTAKKVANEPADIRITLKGLKKAPEADSSHVTSLRIHAHKALTVPPITGRH